MAAPVVPADVLVCSSGSGTDTLLLKRMSIARKLWACQIKVRRTTRTARLARTSQAQVLYPTVHTGRVPAPVAHQRRRLEEAVHGTRHGAHGCCQGCPRHEHCSGTAGACATVVSCSPLHMLDMHTLQVRSVDGKTESEVKTGAVPHTVVQMLQHGSTRRVRNTESALLARAMRRLEESRSGESRGTRGTCTNSAFLF